MVLNLSKGPVQNVSKVPAEVKGLYKTVWEILQKDLMEMVSGRSIFSDQQHSLNIFTAEPNYRIVTVMDFYGWQKQDVISKEVIKYKNLFSWDLFKIKLTNDMVQMELEKTKNSDQWGHHSGCKVSMTKIVIKNTGEKFTLFFSIRSPFSNFYPCKIRVSEENASGNQEMKIFTCTEQYYMYHKALSFSDYGTAFAIMEETEANRIKKLGRYVRNFDPAKWEKMSVEVMRRGNLEKYIQNKELRHNLFCTLGTQMVECSPTDIVWGIG
uniref:NADAR domain-containing protein n=1 Tax=Syphacia muris TaxID=451379 RepID=A0A0N5ALJ1_9BILA